MFLSFCKHCKFPFYPQTITVHRSLFYADVWICINVCIFSHNESEKRRRNKNTPNERCAHQKKKKNKRDDCKSNNNKVIALDTRNKTKITRTYLYHFIVWSPKWWTNMKNIAVSFFLIICFVSSFFCVCVYGCDDRLFYSSSHHKNKLCQFT